MTAPVTQEPTRKAFHFPTSPTGQEADGTEPAVAPEQSAHAAVAVKKAGKSKRPASAEAAPTVKKAAKAKRSAPAEAAPAVKKLPKAKASVTAEAPAVKKAVAPAVKKEAKPKRATVKKAAPAAVEKTAKPKRSATAEAAPAVKKATKPKRSAAEKAVPASAPGAKKAKPVKKEKVVRDSFTMPKSDYDRIASLKQKCLDAGVSVKKSELLRAGLMLLESAAPQRLLAAVSSLETVKTGRPAKD
jgi:hypothetical protein